MKQEGKVKQMEIKIITSPRKEIVQNFVLPDFDICLVEA